MKLKAITNKFMLLSLIILSPITMSHEMDRDCIKHNHLSPNNRYIPQINNTKVCLYNEDDFQGESMCLSHEQGIDFIDQDVRVAGICGISGFFQSMCPGFVILHVEFEEIHVIFSVSQKF